LAVSAFCWQLVGFDYEKAGFFMPTGKKTKTLTQILLY
jgi:hypothetical protein